LALLDRREAVVATATEKLLTYAVGRRVEHFDMPAVRGIVRGAARDGYRFSSLVSGIVRSVPFQMKRKEGAASAASPILEP
jgi:predicted GTPase